MKRCWFGGGLLVFLLIAGFLLTRMMGDFHRELGETMAWAAEIAGEDREAAQAMADQAREKWEKRRKFTAVLNEHNPMEVIEVHFRLLTPAAEEEDFRENCLRLSEQLKALGEAQMLTLENLL